MLIRGSQASLCFCCCLSRLLPGSLVSGGSCEPYEGSWHCAVKDFYYRLVLLSQPSAQDPNGSKVIDQGTCGSCYIVATTHMLAAHHGTAKAGMLVGWRSVITHVYTSYLPAFLVVSSTSSVATLFVNF